MSTCRLPVLFLALRAPRGNALEGRLEAEVGVLGYRRQLRTREVGKGYVFLGVKRLGRTG